MRSSTRFGVAAGVASGAVAIAINLLRGDPQMLSVLPDFATTVTTVAFVSIAVHLAIRRNAGGRAAGLRATMSASLTFAASMGLFTLAYLPSHSLEIAGVAAAA